MLWFYWRRARFGVLITGIALSTVAALVVIAGSVTPEIHHRAPRSVLANRRSVAQPRKVSRSSPVSSEQASRGVELMSAAVTACREVSYSGVQMIAWWGSDDSTAYLIQVWHASGEPEVADGDGDGPEPGSIKVPGTAAADHATAGVLSVSAAMLGLLRANYLIEYAGSGTADSRSAQIVAVRRHDGSLAAQYWLDRATGLPLRREMFDTSGHLVSEGAFIDLSFGVMSTQPVPPKMARAWSSQPSTKDLPALRKQGWPVPSKLAGDMALVGVSRAEPTSGTVLDASYSDGLSVVSVFMQHGQLPKSLPGWTRTEVHGLAVYSSEPDVRSLTWSADGVVYTVISDAPQDTVDRVVTQLPHSHVGGLWQRVGRGLKRMGSWFDPFG
ncbi:MAG TPA: sigma-E factor regulatory protein RseB domain-containing protein [Streptosporangiaceae bacterium]|jgi:sigma-E factor negative regulatory protein RseB|nr:sigma-E factor regulatory protein RseB domain-containing protein [Streptosporangiaceae bacterium]